MLNLPIPDPAGMLRLRTGPAGVHLVAVVALPPGRLLALAAHSPRLAQLLCRAAAAWRTPGTPGCGVLELNGGWRARSLAELQAAVHGTPTARTPAARAAPAAHTPVVPATPPCGTPTAPLEARPAAWAAPAQQPQQMAPPCGQPVAGARPAEPARAGTTSQTGSSGCGCGRGSRPRPTPQAPPASAGQSGRPQTSTTGAEASPHSSSTDTEEGCEASEEACSAPKRRRLGPGPQGAAPPAAERRAAHTLVSLAMPPACCQLSSELPRFTTQELDALQDCLLAPPSQPGGRPAAGSPRSAASRGG